MERGHRTAYVAQQMNPKTHMWNGARGGGGCFTWNMARADSVFHVEPGRRETACFTWNMPNTQEFSYSPIPAAWCGGGPDVAP